MKLKVLHIIDSGGLYGAEVMLLHLMEEQNRIGLAPILASIGEVGIAEKPLEAEAARRGMVVERFRMRPGLNYFGAFEILRYARREGVDLLHSHGYKGDILFGLLPRRFRRLPLVATLHGYTSTRRWSKLRLYEYLDRWSLRSMDAVVLVSRSMGGRLRLEGRLKRPVRVISNGIPPTGEELSASVLDPEVIGYCRGGFCIGAIGRLSIEKGHRFLIDAIALLRSEGVEARLVVLGEGPERMALQQQIGECGLEDCVLLPGYRAEAHRYLSNFDLFVNPSLTEGLPLTILETMQAGVPIVATGVGGVPDLLAEGKGGLLVPPGDDHALAEGIRSLVADPALGRNLAEQAKILVESDFSSRAMGRRYQELYSEILAANVKVVFSGGGG